MQIHGGSEQSGTNLFLHSGYTSASDIKVPTKAIPDQMSIMLMDLSPGDGEEIIDLNQAFLLKGNTYQADQLGSPNSIAKTRIENFAISDLPLTQISIICFFLVAVCFSFRTLQTKIKSFRKTRYWAISGCIYTCLGLATGMSAFFIYNNSEAISTPEPGNHPPAPWEDEKFSLQEYENPESATNALLFGFIRDGIICSKRPVNTLRDIREEITLPTLYPTPGQQYAVDSYGYDGWGTPFLLTDQQESIVVTSAGEDGEFSTEDDLELVVRKLDMQCIYTIGIPTLYLQQWDQDIFAFYHRWNLGRRYNYDLVKAQAHTGNDLYDLWNPAIEFDSSVKYVIERYQQEYLHSIRAKTDAPLVMILQTSEPLDLEEEWHIDPLTDRAFLYATRSMSSE